MRRIQVVLREVDDQTPETSTDLATFDLRATDVTALTPATALDDLETTTATVGNQILQRLLQAQWEVVDTALADAERARLSPPRRRGRWVRQRDGGESLR